MNDNQADALSLLQIWFNKADKWQKDIFCQIWQGNEDINKLIDRAFSLIKAEYLDENSKYVPLTSFPSTIEFSNTNNHPILLKSISKVQGVGALSPTRPLEFGNNLTIVYGENGCGKSSYVRILKSAVSPKNSDAIISNVYESKSPNPQALLTYNDDGEKYEIQWKPNIKYTCPLNIYDSSIAKHFAEEKNEVIYEPHLLSILSIIAKVYEGIKIKLNKLESDNLSQQTHLDKEIENHKFIIDFYSLKTIKAYNQFVMNINWNESQQIQLNTLQEGLQNKNLSEQLEALEAQKKLIDRQYRELINLTTKIGNSFVDEYLSQQKAEINAKQKADSLIKELKKVSIISQTGSDNWKKMWSAAIKFSQELTYKNSNTIIIDGKCILCQQDISEDAKNRINEFYKYMTSTAIKQSEKAHSIFAATVEELKNIYSNINIEQIESILRAGNIENKIISQVLNQYTIIKSRCKWLLECSDGTGTSIPILSEIKLLQDVKDKLLDNYSTKIKLLQNIITNRDKQIILVNNLRANQWISENKLIGKRAIQLKEALSSCKTNALTTLKKELTRILITNTYISRFKEEMEAMDFNHKIKVELISKAEKGKAYHQVALKDAVQKRKTGEVLSEGEFRVVSLAAFLADLSSWNKILPFIFDDPITSLDHKYEKMVAERLVKLSNERQVIVFTHRLTFAQLLVSCIDEYNKNRLDKSRKIECNQIELRNKPLGEPTEPTYRGAIKMKNALNNLKQNIQSLKKQFEHGEYENYDNGIKSLCSNLRKIVEQGIETDLLSSIVTRFNYSVNTLKLKYLYIISKDDIDIFNNMMTKYSAYEHSQSLERIIDLPEIDEIEKDVDSLIEWINDFKKRYNQVDQK